MGTEFQKNFSLSSFCWARVFSGAKNEMHFKRSSHLAERFNKK